MFDLAALLSGWIRGYRVQTPIKEKSDSVPKPNIGNPKNIKTMKFLQAYEKKNK